MGTVMIRCPRTDRAVSTEIDTESSVFERLPEVASRLHCAACGEVHVWTARDAWLSDSPLVVGMGSDARRATIERREPVPPKDAANSPP
jgi:hypothetical protein